MSGCHIVFLGTSSGMPSPTRFCSSLLFRTPRSNFLLDCGEGTAFSLARNRIDPLLIDSIFVSHSHVDHLGGLFLLIQAMYLLERRGALEIYVPDEALSVVRDFFNTCYLFPEKLNFELAFVAMMPGFRFDREGVILTAHPNRHLVGNRTVIEELKMPNRMQSFCFVLNISGRTIVYSSDIESSKDLAEIVDGADILITECVHPRLEELLSLIAEKKVKSVFLTHVPPELEAKEKQILERSKKMGIDGLAFAYDGLSVSA
jgi:ribonuclease Z